MGYNTRAVEFFIMKNGVEICRGFSRADDYYDTGSCVTSVELQAGDQVFVQGYGDFRGVNYSGFSGFQIKAL